MISKLIYADNAQAQRLTHGGLVMPVRHQAII